MNIKINENFSIEIDSIGNHTLIRNQLIKDGKHAGEFRQVTIGYYASTESAIRKLIDLSLSESEDVGSLEAYLKLLKETADKITSDLKKALKH